MKWRSLARGRARRTAQALLLLGMAGAPALAQGGGFQNFPGEGTADQRAPRFYMLGGRGETRAVSPNMMPALRRRVTLELRNVPLSQALEAIAAQDVEAAGREAGGFLDELIEELPS